MQRKSSICEELPPPVIDGEFASEENLQSNIVHLKHVLVGMGMCQDLNLLSTDPADAVQTCNVLHALLTLHQQDTRSKDQFKQEMQRARLDIQALTKDKARLESKVVAKEREIGILVNKSKAGDDAHKDELAKAYRDMEDLQKKLSGYERRLVQMQHEIKRKEREYERLQERLSHYLADKKRNEKAVLEMAGQLTQQLAAGSGATGNSRSIRSDEGIKAVVAAYETKQQELAKENKDLRAALSSLQAEHRQALNLQGTPRGGMAASFGSNVLDESFLKAAPTMGADELRAELASKLKIVQRSMDGLSSARPGSANVHSVAEQRLLSDLQITRGVIRDQEQIIVAGLAALRKAQQNADAQHASDMKGLAQRYQAQLAAADKAIKGVQESQSAAVSEEAARMRDEMATQLGQVRVQRSSACDRADTAIAALRIAEAEKQELKKSIDAQIQAAVSAARADFKADADAAENTLKRAQNKEAKVHAANLEKLEKEKAQLAQTVEKLKKEATALTAETYALRDRAAREKSIAEKVTSERDSYIAKKVAEVTASFTAQLTATEEKCKQTVKNAMRSKKEVEQRLAESDKKAEATLQAAIEDARQQRAAMERLFTHRMQTVEQKTAMVLGEADEKLESKLREAEETRTKDLAAAAAQLAAMQESLNAAREEAAKAQDELRAKAEQDLETMLDQMRELNLQKQEEYDGLKQRAAQELKAVEEQVEKIKLAAQEEKLAIEKEANARVEEIEQQIAALKDDHQAEKESIRQEMAAKLAAVEAQIAIVQQEADERVAAAQHEAAQFKTDTMQKASNDASLLEARLEEVRCGARAEKDALRAQMSAELSAMEGQIAKIQQQADERIATALQEVEQARIQAKKEAAAEVAVLEGRLKDAEQQVYAVAQLKETAAAEQFTELQEKIAALKADKENMQQAIEAEKRTAAMHEESKKELEQAMAKQASKIAELEQEVNETSGKHYRMQLDLKAAIAKFDLERKTLTDEMLVLREQQNIERDAAVAAAQAQIKSALSVQLSNADEEKAELRSRVDQLSSQITLLQKDKLAALEAERAAAAEETKRAVREAVQPLLNDKERVERELALFKRDFNMKIETAMRDARMQLEAERAAMKQETTKATRRIREELAALSKENTSLKVGLEEEKKKAVAAADARAAEKTKELQARLTALEEAKSTWGKEKYQKFSVALKVAESDKQALEECQRKLAESADRVAFLEHQIIELTARSSMRPGVFTPAGVSHADQRLELALRRADSEKKDALKEAAMEREYETEELQTKLEAALSENAELQKRVQELESGPGEGNVLGRNGSFVNSDRLSELQNQLEAERAASEGKDKRLREAIIQAEAARRASMQAIDKQRQYEELQQKYKELMAQYVPGLGAGALLERSISRKAKEFAEALEAENLVQE